MKISGKVSSFKANVSQENQVLCHILRQFSIVLFWNTVHLKQHTFESVLRHGIILNFSTDNPAFSKQNSKLRIDSKPDGNQSKLKVCTG